MAPVTVKRFRATWGFEPGTDYADWAAWFPKLKAQGYAGIELTVLALELDTLPRIKAVVDALGLEVIALCNSAPRDPEGQLPAGLTVADHLRYYRANLVKAAALGAIKVNCQSGCDTFSLDESVAFYRGTLAVDAELGFAGRVCHETHRKCSLFNAATTAAVLRQVPALRLTLDISHHVLVAERLLGRTNADDRALVRAILPHVRHIHARIGTTQGSQCPEPTNPVFAPERAYFEGVWRDTIAAIRQAEPAAPITFDPEYGPYPYHAFSAAQSFSDLADAEGARLQPLFEQFVAAAAAAAAAATAKQ